jgi:hypothetical protein
MQPSLLDALRILGSTAAGAVAALPLGALIALLCFYVRSRRDPNLLWGVWAWPILALVFAGLYGAPCGAVLGLIVGCILFPGGLLPLAPVLVVAGAAGVAWWRGRSRQ